MRETEVDAAADPSTVAVLGQEAALRGASRTMASWRFERDGYRITVYRHERSGWTVSVSTRIEGRPCLLVKGEGRTLEQAERHAAIQIKQGGRGA